MFFPLVRAARFVALVVLALSPVAAPVADARESRHRYDDVVVDLPAMQPMRGALARRPAPAKVAAEPKPTVDEPAPRPIVQPAPIAAAPPKSIAAPVQKPVAETAPKAAVEPRAADVGPQPVADAPPVAASAPAKQPVAAAPAIPAPKAEEPVAAPEPVAPPAVAAAPEPAPAEQPASAPSAAASEPAPVAAAPAPQPVATQRAEPAPAETTPALAGNARVAEPKREPTPEPLDTDASSDPKDLIAQGVAGPAQIPLAERAVMWLPANRVFLAPELAKKFLERVGGSWDPATQGVVVPAGDVGGWIAYIDVVDDGHIMEDDARTLDPAALLAAYRAGLARDNEARVKEGLAAMDAAGWLAEPRYDEKRLLSSCIAARAAGAPTGLVNCATYALGRQGAFKVIASFAEDEAGKKALGEATALAAVIAYDNRKAYADFDPATDKVAPYGLAALVAGDYAPRKTPAAPPAPRAKQEALTDAILSTIMDNLPVIAGLVLAALLLLRKFSAKSEMVDAPAPRGGKPPVDKKPKAEKDAGPVWTRFVAAARAKIGEKTAPAAKAASAESDAAGGAETLAGGLTTPAGSLAARVADLRAALFARFARGPKEAGEPARPTVPAESALSPLQKMGALMRRKAEEPATPRASVDLSRVSRAGRISPRTIAEEDMEDEEVAMAAPAARPVAAPAAASSALDLDEFGLVEPGDEAAASAAINARAALRESRG
jgi:uncharacterized membrane-anchored protein